MNRKNKSDILGEESKALELRETIDQGRCPQLRIVSEYVQDVLSGIELGVSM